MEHPGARGGCGAPPEKEVERPELREDTRRSGRIRIRAMIAPIGTRAANAACIHGGSSGEK